LNKIQTYTTSGLVNAMTHWHSQFTRQNTNQAAPPSAVVKTASVAFPNCSMRGGLCETLLTNLPMAIIVIQFIRDGYEVVQDGIITLANDSAAAAFAPGAEKLTGSLFLTTCSSSLPFGAWQRCLWVASSGKTEIMVDPNIGPSGQCRTLTIATYGDGLILARSLDMDLRKNAPAL
jgi:hypothetical protein